MVFLCNFEEMFHEIKSSLLITLHFKFLTMQNKGDSYNIITS